MGVKYRNFLSYLEARKLVIALKLHNQREWVKYYKSKERTLNIPSDPVRVYKDNGWVSWMDWLGTNNHVGYDRIYKINDNYFKTWSSNMAYILGFWFADGCIKKANSYIFSITQNEKDKYLLEAILKEMDSNYLLTKSNRGCISFQINSKIIYDDVIKLGGKERKSLDIKFPYVPKEYLPDFVRGLWDGDGTIYYNKHRRIHAFVSGYCSASKDFIEQLHRVLRENITHLGGCIVRVNNSYNLAFAPNDTIRLKKFMYQEPLEGRLMLKRKYDLFLKTKYFCSREFLDYNDAQQVAIQFCIKSKREWKLYCDDGLIPHNIPLCPHIVYKNSGWVGWHGWLGKTRKYYKSL